MKSIVITKVIRPGLLAEELKFMFGWSYSEVNPNSFYFSSDFIGDSLLTHLHVPDNANVETVQQLIDLHNPAAQTQGDMAYTTISNLAQSSVGIKLVDLTSAQIKALMAVLLLNAGGVNISNMTVRPLGEWVIKNN